MGPDQLAAVMRTVGKPAEETEKLRERIEFESRAIFGSARLWDDGIIPPSQTREYLAAGLRAAKANPVAPGDGDAARDEFWSDRANRWGVFRM